MESPKGHEAEHRGGYLVQHTETGESFDINWRHFEIEEELQLAGLYEHYKSTTHNPRFYEVDYVVRNKKSGECFVMYHPLYESEDDITAARPLDSFMGSVIVGGEELPRFKMVRFDR